MLGLLLLLSLFPVVFCGSLEGYITNKRRRIDTHYFNFLYDAAIPADCVKNGCQSGRSCFWAFDRRHLKCYYVNFPLGVFLFNMDNMIKYDRDWTLIYPENAKKSKTMFANVKVLWLLDHINKGRNFGNTGPAINIPTDNVYWSSDAKGPTTDSPLLYAQGKDKQAVSIYNGGTYAVDMLSIFTIAMWIKTDNSKGKAGCLLCGDPSYSARFALWPSLNKNQLTIAFDASGTHTITTINNDHVNEWRHVAVTYDPNTPVFYLNGNVWPIKRKRTSYGTKIQPSKFVMWTSTNPGVSNYMKYYGKIACVAVFQMVLNKDDINFLKNNCP